MEKMAAELSGSKSGGLFGVGALQQMSYCHKSSDTDQLLCILISCWAQLSQDTLNRATDQLPKRLMIIIKAMGAHVEFSLD